MVLEIFLFKQSLKLIYGSWWKEGNALFNDALNTFYLWLYGIKHMVKDHSDSERGTPLPSYGLLFPIAARVLLYASSHIQNNTYHDLCYTSRGALAGINTHESLVQVSYGFVHTGARCRYVAEHLLMVWWVVGSILHSRPIDLFLFPASAPQLVYQRLWYVLSCLWCI